MLILTGVAGGTEAHKQPKTEMHDKGRRLLSLIKELFSHFLSLTLH